MLPFVPWTMRTSFTVAAVRRLPLTVETPFPTEVAVVVAVRADVLALVAVVVVPVTVDAAETAGFVAAVGEAVSADEVVAVGSVVPAVAANWPGVAVVAALAGVRSVVGAVMIGAAAAVTPVVLAAEVTVGAAVAAELTPVVPPAAVTVGAAVAAAVTLVVPAAPLITAAPVVPLAATSPAKIAEASSPPAPLEMTGVGAELIEEFTVNCGLAVADGETNWPVGAICGAITVPPETAGAGPRSRPWWPARKASVAAASSARETGAAGAVPRSTDDDSIDGGVPVVPEDEPGVADGWGLTPIPGSPFPGVRFVEQPKAARERVSDRAASVWKPFVFLELFVMTLSPFRWSRSHLLRARSGPLFIVSGIA
jgi:hypothetical protein